MFWDVVLRSAGLWMILSLAAGQLTEQEKSTLVDMHNKIRSEVQPRAAFMQKVVWDETLRLVAESYAAKCIWNHNPELEDLKLGENLFVSTGQFNATKAMLKWFDEKADYDYKKNVCLEDRMCGHYTQMVWADSNRIGCATHFCDSLEGLDFKKATVLVCNYYPQGNFEEQKPYESGEPCSKCPDNLLVCESNICVAENLFHPSEDPDDTEYSTLLPEHPHMTTKPVDAPREPTNAPGEATHPPGELTNAPREPTHVHVKIIETGLDNTKTSHGSKMESLFSALLMLVGLVLVL